MFKQRIRKKLITLGLWMVVLPLMTSLGQSPSQHPSDERKSLPAKEISSDGDYVIKPGDALEIFVWKEPDLSRKAVVRVDGKITIPLIQDVQAAGLTASELKKSLEDKLKEFVEVPNVTIILDSISTQAPNNQIPVFLVGKVNRPGPLLVPKPADVLQVLSLVGGFQEFASVKKIIIIRKAGGERKVLHFNYKDVVKGKNLEQNIQLEAGDTIVVP